MRRDFTPKLARLRAAWEADDKLAALSIAAKFPSLGAQRDVILTAWGAHTNPEFYRQMGRDPDRLIAAGLDAMGAKYGLR